MYAQADSRPTLPDCGRNTITLNNVEFQINPDKEAGRGGTCLVYHAYKKEEPNISRKVILKEFYPLTVDCESWRQKDGSLMLPDRDPEVAFRKSRFERSRKLFVEFHNEDSLNLNMAEAQEYIPANGTVYMVVDYSSGKSLQTYLSEGNHSLFDTLSILKNLAAVLGRIHAMHYLHMDLKPENVLCYENGLVRVIDTDTFLAMDDLKKRRNITLSFSQGFAAPEVLACAKHPENRSNWMCLSQSGKCTDVFSFGAVLHCALFGETPDPQRFASRRENHNADIAGQLQEKYPDIPRKAVHLLQKLLTSTLARLYSDRYSSMEKIAADLDQILPLVSPKEIRVAEYFIPNPYPVFGREQKLAELREKLLGQKSVSRIVCITGIGGVGKSTLARLYGDTYGAEYDIITEVSATSAEKAVEEIQILNWEPDQKKLAELSRKYKTLIIVNDYDVSQDADDSFHIWRELGCDVILTSRHDWSLSGVSTVILDSDDLSPEKTPNAAASIFTQFYLQEAKAEADRNRLTGYLANDKEALSVLLNGLSYHPLSIKLMARYMTTIQGEELAPAQVLDLLEQGQGLFQKDSPSVFQNDRDSGSIRSANVYGHLESIFRAALQPGQLQKEELDALRYMTLESRGISTKRFSRWTGLSPEYLENLRKRGWLERLPHQDQLEFEPHRGTYLMPLIIREVLSQQETMLCTVENCERYLLHALVAGFGPGDSSRQCYYNMDECIIRTFSREAQPRPPVLYLDPGILSWSRHTRYYTKEYLKALLTCLLHDRYAFLFQAKDIFTAAKRKRTLRYKLQFIAWKWKNRPKSQKQTENTGLLRCLFAWGRLCFTSFERKYILYMLDWGKSRKKDAARLAKKLPAVMKETGIGKEHLKNRYYLPQLVKLTTETLKLEQKHDPRDFWKELRTIHLNEGQLDHVFFYLSGPYTTAQLNDTINPYFEATGKFYQLSENKKNQITWLGKPVIQKTKYIQLPSASGRKALQVARNRFYRCADTDWLWMIADTFQDPVTLTASNNVLEILRLQEDRAVLTRCVVEVSRKRSS